MGNLDGYIVDLKGVTDDTVSYRWQVGNDFFSAVQGPEIKQGLLDVALRVKQTSGAYELEFQLKGEVEVSCDRCLEPMSCPIEAQNTLKVVMGEEYADNGDVVTVPEKDGTINVAWNIYEFAALQIPLRHVHEECEQSLSDSSEGERSDPCWDALKKIVNK
ncbi:MAG: DUF177 domain-containing protein [Bacteroidaceae bacterium]|nr:DUF177 domain-containing protein [Bacteroidaceae bacterium]